MMNSHNVVNMWYVTIDYLLLNATQTQIVKWGSVPITWGVHPKDLSVVWGGVRTRSAFAHMKTLSKSELSRRRLVPKAPEPLPEPTAGSDEKPDEDCVSNPGSDRAESDKAQSESDSDETTLEWVILDLILEMIWSYLDLWGWPAGQPAGMTMQLARGEKWWTNIFII